MLTPISLEELFAQRDAADSQITTIVLNAVHKMKSIGGILDANEVLSVRSAVTKIERSILFGQDSVTIYFTGKYDAHRTVSFPFSLILNPTDYALREYRTKMDTFYKEQAVRASERKIELARSNLEDVKHQHAQLLQED